MSENTEVKNIMKAIDLAIMAQVNLQLTLFDANKLKVHIDALNAENAALREQLRWRLTATEKPDTGELVMVQDTLQYMTTFVYHPALDDSFTRRRYWLPIPPIDIDK